MPPLLEYHSADLKRHSAHFTASLPIVGATLPDNQGPRDRRQDEAQRLWKQHERADLKERVSGPEERKRNRNRDKGEYKCCHGFMPDISSKKERQDAGHCDRHQDYENNHIST